MQNVLYKPVYDCNKQQLSKKFDLGGHKPLICLAVLEDNELNSYLF